MFSIFRIVTSHLTSYDFPNVTIITFLVYFGIYTVQLRKDGKHVNIQVKQKPSMIM